MLVRAPAPAPVGVPAAPGWAAPVAEAQEPPSPVPSSPQLSSSLPNERTSSLESLGSIGAALSRTSATLGVTTSASSMLNGRGSAAAMLAAQGQTKPEALRDVALGPLVGAGSFGRVFRAVWRGTLIAAKVRAEACEPLGQRDWWVGKVLPCVLVCAHRAAHVRRPADQLLNPGPAASATAFPRVEGWVEAHLGCSPPPLPPTPQPHTHRCPPSL